MVPSSSRWRIYITESYGGGGTSLSAFQMASSAGGTDLCTGGTAVADSVWDSSYTAAKAFDGNAGTRWNNGPSPSPSLPAWLEYQFASVVTIVEYRLQAGTDYAGGNPKSWRIEYWTGSAWASADERTGQASWTLGETRTYSVPDPAFTEGRLSQLPAEALRAVDTATIPAQLSQLPVEVLRAVDTATIPAQLSQLPVEVLYLPALPTTLLLAADAVTVTDAVVTAPRVAVSRTAFEVTTVTDAAVTLVRAAMSVALHEAIGVTDSLRRVVPRTCVVYDRIAVAEYRLRVAPAHVMLVLAFDYVWAREMAQRAGFPVVWDGTGSPPAPAAIAGDYWKLGI